MQPNNVRWASITEQANNRRNNVMIEWNGKTQSLPDWCRELGIDLVRTRARLKRGGTVDFAFSGGLLKSYSYISYSVNGIKYETLAEVAKAHNMSLSGCHGRFNSTNYPNWIKE